MWGGCEGSRGREKLPPYLPPALSFPERIHRWGGRERGRETSEVTRKGRYARWCGKRIRGLRRGMGSKRRGVGGEGRKYEGGAGSEGVKEEAERVKKKKNKGR